MVLISKMRLVCLIGYPRALKRLLLGGLWGAKGVEINKPLKIMLYINSRAVNGADFKNEIGFPFRITSDPNQGGLGELRGETNTTL